MIRAFAIAAALLGHAVSAQATNKDFNISIVDNDPQITYTPVVPQAPANGSTGLAVNTWNVTFTDVPWSSWVESRVGRGTGYHTTAKKGANAAVSWYGTAVYFFGYTEEGGTVGLQVDGGSPSNPAPASEGLLAGATGLQLGYHTAVLTFTGSSGAVYISNVDMTSTMQIEAESPEKANVTTVMAIVGPNEDALNPVIKNQQTPDNAKWNVHDLIGASGDQVMYHRMDTSNAGSWLTLEAPDNSAFVQLQGSMGYDHGHYSVVANPAPLSGKANTTLNGYSPWTVTNTTLYAATLDPAQKYTFTITCLDDGRWLDFHMASFWSSKSPTNTSTGGNSTTNNGGNSGHSTSSSSSSGLSAGAIAGIVVGIVVGLAIIGGLIAFCCMRKRKNAHKTYHDTAQDGNFIVDEAAMSTVTPHTGIMSHNSRSGPHSYMAGNQGYMPGGHYAASSSGGTDMTPLTSVGEHSTTPLALKRQLLAGHSGLPHDSPDGVSYVTDTDAGPAGGSVQLMPPSYNPDWSGSGTALSSSTSPDFGPSGGDSQVGSMLSQSTSPSGASTQRSRSTYKAPIRRQ